MFPSTQVTEPADAPSIPLSGISRKLLRKDRLRLLREHRKLVDKITGRLYEVKSQPIYIAEHREVQSRVLNLRQVTRQSKNEKTHPGLSTIHNMSLSMIEDIKGAKVRRGSCEDWGDGEDMENRGTHIPRQASLQYLPPSRKPHIDQSSPSSQLKALTVKMEQVLNVNSKEMTDGHKSIVDKKPNAKLKEKSTFSKTRTFLSEAELKRLKEDAEVVQTQLKRDVKRIDTKLRLLISSVLLLEDEMKKCSSVCVAEKRRILQTRVNSLYTLMDFLKQTKALASDYVSQIEGVLLLNVIEEPDKDEASLIQDIRAMMTQGKAIEFVTSKIQAKRRPHLSKKELVKYNQVTFSKVTPAIMKSEDEKLPKV